MPLQIDRILFPTDFSACAEGAYRHAAFLADRLGAELHILHVVPSEAAPERDWPETAGTGALQITLGDVAADLGLPAPPHPTAAVTDTVAVVETEVVAPDVATAILDAAHDEEVGLVVIGTHGRTGWRRGVLGSVAEAVARRAPCPVLTVRPLDASGTGDWPPRSVVLAVDAEALAEPGTAPGAARWAARLAAAYGARLELVHAAAPGVPALAGGDEAAEDRAHLRDRLLALAETLRADADAPLPVGVTVRTELAADLVEAVAREVGAHLVVVGSHARRGARRVLLGSVAEDVMRHAPCPVLVVRDALHAVPELSAADAASQ